MRRSDLAHILRAATEVGDDGEILVIGSQAILATYSERELPPEATVSIEADIAFFDDSNDEKADRVDGAIGEASMFHSKFGYYGQGVGLSTAKLPKVGRTVWCLSNGETLEEPSPSVSNLTTSCWQSW